KQGGYTELDRNIRCTFHKIVRPLDEEDESRNQNNIRQMTHSPLKYRLPSLYSPRKIKNPLFKQKVGFINHFSFSTKNVTTTNNRNAINVILPPMMKYTIVNVSLEPNGLSI